MPQSDERLRQRLERLEREARTRPRRHALRITLLIITGYLYPVVILGQLMALAIGLLFLAPVVMRDWSVEAILAFAVLLGGTLVAAALLLGGLWRTHPAPEGLALKPEEAPPLRDLITRVRQRGDWPPIHEIRIAPTFNIAVSQRRRWGLWGPRTNYLILGPPMLQVLSVSQLGVVLIHELAHLRGRHMDFRAWVYRMHRAWQTIAGDNPAKRSVRHALMGWFIRWFSPRLDADTLPLRRMHEYEADHLSAEVFGADATADALLTLAWSAYRLEQEFWPRLMHQAGAEALPPLDLLGRQAEHLASPPATDVFARWRRRELRCKTPVTQEHPCLADRLRAIGRDGLLHHDDLLGLLSARQDDDRASSLFGPAMDRVLQFTNAAWRAGLIQDWRMEHARVRALTDGSHAEPASEPRTPLDQLWNQLEAALVAAAPDLAPGMLLDFIEQHPTHAPARLALGARLLIRDDDAAALPHLEAAQRHDSRYITPALQGLLHYYRQAGRDADADLIARRLEEHDRRTHEARQERTRLRRRDRLEPHDRSPSDLERVARALFFFPQVHQAYLARRLVRHFADQKHYVLVVCLRPRPWGHDRRTDASLAKLIEAGLHFDCLVTITTRPTPTLLKACPEPVYPPKA